MSSFLTRLLSKPAGPVVIAPAAPPVPTVTAPPADPLTSLRAQVAASAVQTANLTNQVTVLTTERDQLAAQVATLTTERDGLRTQTTRTREDLTTEIRNQELSRLAAGQGIPPGQVPPTDEKDKGGTQTSWRETYDAITDPIARSESVLKAMKMA